MSRKKHVLMAAGAALSLGLCVGVSGCASPTSPDSDPGSTEQVQPAKAEAPYIEEFEVNHDLRWYCFDSALVIVAKNGNNGVAINSIPGSAMCAE